MGSAKPSIVVVRGHLATPWELRPWELLGERFDVSYLGTRSNAFDVSTLGLRRVPVRTLRDSLPRGRLGDAVATAVGDRYVGLARWLGDADLVHAEELGFWFAAEVSRARRSAGARFRLVQTIWETIPMLDAYRNRHARRHRRDVLAETDLFLAATERARQALRLEGVAEDRIELCPPGVDLDRFAPSASPHPSFTDHLVVSPGRLVWEKGHQDVLRAVAALRDGLVGPPVPPPRVRIVGRGPEEGRLRAYAHELGLADGVELGGVDYDDMPGLYARASCLVLASLPHAGGGLHPLDVPRVFWEEQFGMVLAEAMAAGLDVIATTSGAIPEVLGDSGTYFPPGDWLGLARALCAGPLARPPGARVVHPRKRVERYSARAAADRLAAAYSRLLEK
jgi:glycosyltransferase involved in cell wall biosynthesis